MRRTQIYDNKMKILLRRHGIFDSFEFQFRAIVVSLVNFELAQFANWVCGVFCSFNIRDIKPICKIFAVSSKEFYQESLDISQWRSLTNFEGKRAGAIWIVEGLS